jgi:E3 ubiquitin-protein ligase RNF213
LLEVENRDIAFVGISNWRLDASKMNRAIYISRQELDEEDLKLSAFSIY